MKNAKRILALAGAIILAALYILTFIFSMMNSEVAQGLFRASFACTFIIPVIMYAYMLFYKVNHKDDDKGSK